MDAQGNFWRAIATIVIWVMATGSIALSGIFLADKLGEDVIAVIVVSMIAAALSSGFIWNWGRTGMSRRRRRHWASLLDEALETRSYSQEKPKREDDRLAEALRQLSDRQLHNLRDGIRSGEISDDDLETMLGDTLE